jgi:hypothetical protein
MLISAATALLLPIGIAHAVNLPEQKEGLWSIQTQSVDNPGNKKIESTSTICRSHAYDQYVRSLTKTLKDCTTVNESFQAGKYHVEVHCAAGGVVTESKGTTTFQATSAHAETHVTYTPAFDGVSETTVIMDQKYIGSCPAGAQPGDMTHADGRVTHLWKH